jgi:recombination protein RecA
LEEVMKEAKESMDKSREDRLRAEALQQTLDGLEKKWGKGTVMRLGEGRTVDTEVISSGSLSLDLALGVGGYPRGRLVEVFGQEASGKTTLALHAIASVQARGGTAAIIDAEHALDPSYAEKLGVNLEQLLVAQPDSGEQALEVTEALLRSGAVDLVIVDSVAALVPQAELDGDMGDQHMGLQARLMSQALRKITAVTNRSHAIVMFINQVRQKIGVTFGNGEVTTGGNALKYYASVRIEIKRIGSIKKGEDTIGARTRIKVVKNKLAPPFQQVEVDVMYGRGVCRAGELLQLAEERGVLQKSGSWYSVGDERLGQGYEAVREQVTSDTALAERIARLLSSEGPAAAK